MLKEDGGSGGRKLRELNKVLFVSGVAKEGTGDKKAGGTPGPQRWKIWSQQMEKNIRCPSQILVSSYF